MFCHRLVRYVAMLHDVTMSKTSTEKDDSQTLSPHHRREIRLPLSGSLGNLYLRINFPRQLASVERTKLTKQIQMKLLATCCDL